MLIKKIKYFAIVLAAALLCFTASQAIAATPATYTAGTIAGGIADYST